VKKTREKFTLSTEIISYQFDAFHIMFTDFVNIQRAEAKMLVTCLHFANNLIGLQERVIGDTNDEKL
jgi:hypothetical protein